MNVPTRRLEHVAEAAQALSEAATAVLDIRDDPDADEDERYALADELDVAWQKLEHAIHGPSE